MDLCLLPPIDLLTLHISQNVPGANRIYTIHGLFRSLRRTNLTVIEWVVYQADEAPINAKLQQTGQVSDVAVPTDWFERYTVSDP